MLMGEGCCISQGKSWRSVVKALWNAVLGPAGLAKDVLARKCGMWITDVAAWSNLVFWGLVRRKG